MRRKLTKLTTRLLPVLAILLFTLPTRAQAPQIQPRTGGSNYFLVNVCDFSHGCRGSGDSETGLATYRVDLEIPIVTVSGYPEIGRLGLVMPLRFRAFWDLFNRLPGSESSPFVETDYQPGMELNWAAPSTDYLQARAGVLHESNGIGNVGTSRRRTDSRSWNRVYIGARGDLVDNRRLGLTLDAWAWRPFVVDRVHGWRETLADFAGPAEVSATGRLTLSRYMDWILRLAARTRAVEGEFRWSLRSSGGLVLGAGNFLRLDAVLHCYAGRGQRLITADRFDRSCYVGVGF